MLVNSLAFIHFSTFSVKENHIAGLISVLITHPESGDVVTCTPAELETDSVEEKI